MPQRRSTQRLVGSAGRHTQSCRARGCAKKQFQSLALKSLNPQWSRIPIFLVAKPQPFSMGSLRCEADATEQILEVRLGVQGTYARQVGERRYSRGFSDQAKA